MKKIWTEKELKELEELVNKGYTKSQLAEYFDRTTTAIQIKVNRMGLAIKNQSDNKGTRGRAWTKKDIDLLTELWQDPEISKSVMQQKLCRSWYSIRKQALLSNLGSREFNSEFLTIDDVSREMNVSRDRIARWHTKGLKYRKNKSGKVRILIDVNDLLDFLKSHQDVFNACEVSNLLFANEPEWLKEKRKQDRKINIERSMWEYTNEEDKAIVQYFKLGKSDKFIAEQLNRTEVGIEYHRRILGLYRGIFNDYEVEIIKRYSRYKTVYELAKMLPLRTADSIEYYCTAHQLPYHLSKKKCEVEP